MTINCPNCGKSLKGKQEERLICYTCGTITDEVETIQIGIGKYKFLDDSVDYIIVFETKQDLYDLKHQFQTNKKDYKYCKIVTPEGVENIV